MASKCAHESVRQVGPDFAFIGSVAHPPFTHDNPSAHGNITYTQRCDGCGAERQVNQNQGHVEFSPWRQRGD